MIRALAIVALVACGTRDTELFASADAGLDGLVALAVTPATASLAITDLASPREVPLVATGTFADGSTRDVSALVQWSTTPDFLGAVELGPATVWRTSNRAGGVATVVASSGALAATSTIAVAVHATVLDPAAPPPAPFDTAAPFDPPTPVVVGDPTYASSLAYPEDATLFPRDVAPIELVHAPAATTGAYRLHVVAPYLDLSILTTAARYTPARSVWELVMLSGAGGDVALAIDALDRDDPSTVWSSETATFGVTREPVGGVLAYWSSGTSSLVEAELGAETATAASPVAPDTKCVGCHRSTRDGTRLAASYDGKELLVARLAPDRALEVAPPAGGPAAWSTLSPDGTRVVVADKGKLALRDATTGAPIPAMGLGGMLLANTTMPDWSPRGDALVAARCGKPEDRDVETCSIVRLGFDGTRFTAPAVVVPQVTGTNAFAPRFSPDGSVLLYTTTTGSSRATADTATLQLVAITGGASRPLARANRGAGNAFGAWAPVTRPGLQWIAFASARTGIEQIWIAAIDPARPGDPSSPAFRLPAQDPATRNRGPDWRLAASPASCALAEVCDGFDNDCDGIIDDACRPCAAIDTCGDGIDNDCDGSIDQGCVFQ